MTPAARFQIIILAVLLLAGGDLVPAAYGHALQPGFLELRQLDDDRYGVLWKKPAVAGAPMAIEANLPVHCSPRVAEHAEWDGVAYLSRWTATCPGGLEGGQIAIAGLDRTSTDVLVRFEFSDGASGTRRLTATDTSFVIPERLDSLEVVRTYLLYGVEHILLGFDHLLFVLALLLLVRGAGRIVTTVTAFTLAHSLTLAGATLGWVHVPGPPVEATIALSIAFVASEIIHGRQGRVGFTERYPWTVAFTFGLLHGFGFAGALAEVGLPQHAIPMALLFFNVGVEVGQLLFIAAVFATLGVFRRIVALPVPSWAMVAVPYAIGSLAMFWAVQRTVAFLP